MIRKLSDYNKEELQMTIIFFFSLSLSLVCVKHPKVDTNLFSFQEEEKKNTGETI